MSHKIRYFVFKVQEEGIVRFPMLYVLIFPILSVWAWDAEGGLDVSRGDLVISDLTVDELWKDTKASDQSHKSILGNVTGIIGATPLFIIEGFLRCYVLTVTTWAGKNAFALTCVSRGGA